LRVVEIDFALELLGFLANDFEAREMDFEALDEH
jgi:hypothetical protein